MRDAARHRLPRTCTLEDVLVCCLQAGFPTFPTDGVPLSGTRGKKLWWFEIGGQKRRIEVALGRDATGTLVPALPQRLRYPRRQSAPASKSKPSDTRARLPLKATGNVEATQGTRPRFSPERSQHAPKTARAYSCCSTCATAATARSTSCSLVCQLHTETRIQRCPRQVVPLKKASPVSAIRAITASVCRS